MGQDGLEVSCIIVGGGKSDEWCEGMWGGVGWGGKWAVWVYPPPASPCRQRNVRWILDGK